MAYGGTFEQLVESAKNRENLFEGDFVNEFTPFSVRNNQRVANAEKRKELEPDYDISKMQHKALTKSDAMKDGKAKNIASVKPISVDAPRRPAIDVTVDESSHDMELE